MSVDRPTRYGRARAAGRTGWQLRTDVSPHPYWGVVSPVDPDLDGPDLRIAEAVEAMTGNSVLTGWAAARRQGVLMLDGRGQGLEPLPITIASPDIGQHRHQPGLHPTRRLLLAGEITEFDGIRVATIARAAYDMALDAPNLREAVVAIDMCVSTIIGQSRTTVDNVRAVIGRHAKTKGIARARRAAELASSRSASPGETRTRLIAESGAGLRNLRVNAPVFDMAGELLGIADLLDPVTGLVIESDGAGHREERAHSSDNIREEKFERCLLTVVRVSGLEHRHHGQVAARIQAARRNAQELPNDRWTLEKPEWWWRWPPGRRWD